MNRIWQIGWIILFPYIQILIFGIRLWDGKLLSVWDVVGFYQKILGEKYVNS